MNNLRPILEVRNISYGINQAPILSRVSLSFYPHRTYAVVGPNGAGKSTLIRLLCLLTKPTSGSVFIEGQDATSLWPDVLHLRRRLALVTQTPIMFKSSVFDNVALGLRFRKISSREIKRKVEEALSFVSMAHLEARYAPTLSVGEAQMVALARAIVLQPRALLLDEPASNLDPQNAKALEQHLQRLVRERGTTIIMVTHSLKQAHRLAHEAVFLYGGRVVETGKVPDFFNRPRQEQTRRFLEGELFL